MSNEAYEVVRKERKQMQQQGLLPEWMQTIGYDLFKKSYLWEAGSWKEQIKRISSNLAKYAPTEVPDNVFGSSWEKVFFELINQNIFVLATPTLANNGTTRGLSVSCSGQYIGDSIDSFYSNLYESAVLSKHGFGTSGYFGDIRPRGSSIKSGGIASGALPVLADFWTMADKVSQSGVRRGSFAGYINISSPDYDEVIHYVKSDPDGKHLGVNINDQEIYDIVNKKSMLLVQRFQKLMELRMMGRGYIHIIDNVNRANPKMYTDNGLSVKASNLCNEIELHQDEEHTFSCVIGAMNAVTYSFWKSTNAVFLAQVMLDCMVSDFLVEASAIEGMEKIIRHTMKGRAVGLGVTGLHTHMQEQGMIFGEWDSMMLNNEIYSHLHEQSDKASKWLAAQLGEPEWCTGSGYRNTHRLAQMPNKSSSLIFGQVSEGISPMTGNIFNQRLSTGEAFRINPNFIKLLKDKGKFNDNVLASVSLNNGSCQHLDFLTTYEKALFRTAFEIPQNDIISMAEQRQKYIDQGQSLNLFIPQNATPKYVADLHIRAISSNLLKGLYYVNTANADYKVIETCSSCES